MSYISREPFDPDATPLDGAEPLHWVPDALQLAVAQSGILEDGGSLAWLQDRRVIAALHYAHAAHGGKKRKYGAKGQESDRLIHEIWCAHRAFNDPEMKRWLAAHTYDPLLGVVGMIFHDAIENRRSLETRNNRPFNGETVTQDIAKIWNDPHSLPELLSFVEYMTDDPDIHKDIRIDAQRKKSFDENENSKVNFFKERGRTIDKLSHVCLDAAECLAGHLTPQEALKLWIKAILKSYVLNFPTTTAKTRIEYFKAMMTLQHKTNLPFARLKEELTKSLGDSEGLYSSHAKALERTIRDALHLMKNVHSSPLPLASPH